jgi:hypothetical protein
MTWLRLSLSSTRAGLTLDPNLAASISQTIWHVLLKPLSMLRDQISGKEFDLERAVELEKCAKQILFVPSPPFA